MDIELDYYDNGNRCHTVTWEDAQGDYHEANFSHRADAELFVSAHQAANLT